MGVELVLVDTNVLLTATTPARQLHAAALSVLNEWPNRGVRLCTCGQILREYLVVATRRPEVNGLGLSRETALGNVEKLAARMRFLDEDQRVAASLQSILRRTECSGRQIHDANLVAVAERYEVARLVTANAGDFVRFRAYLKTLELGSDDQP